MLVNVHELTQASMIGGSALHEKIWKELGYICHQDGSFSYSQNYSVGAADLEVAVARVLQRMLDSQVPQQAT